MGQRDYFKKPALGASNNSLVILFAANAFIFIVLRVIKLAYDIEHDAAAFTMFRRGIWFWFTLSPQAFNYIHKAWTIFTYMFTHFRVISFVTNMAWLWSFGQIMQDLLGNRKIVPLYLYGGFLGGLVFMLSATYIPWIHAHTPNYFLLEGCNASIVAIAFATTTIAPKYKVFRHIREGFPMWILTVVFCIADIGFLMSTNIAVVISHIFAAFFGFLFIKQLNNGNDWGKWMFDLVDKVDNLFNPEKKYKNKPQTANVFYTQKVPAFEKTENVTENRLNEILDKINSNGYSSLSKDEVEFLDRASKS